eukprot:gene17813-24191_t
MILEPVGLTASGRPVLVSGEVERYLLDKVDLEFTASGGLPGQEADAYKGGYVILTSQRLIWMDASATAGSAAVPGSEGPRQGGRSCHLPVASIKSCTKKTSVSFKSKVRLKLEVCCNYERKPVDAEGQFHQLLTLSLRCKGDSPEALASRVQEVKALAATTNRARPAQPPPAQAPAQRPPPSQPHGTALPPAQGGPLTAGLAAQGAGGRQQQLPPSEQQAVHTAPPRLQPDPSLLQMMVEMLAAQGAGGRQQQLPPPQQLTAQQYAAPPRLQLDPGLLKMMVPFSLLEASISALKAVEVVLDALQGFPHNRTARSLVATNNVGVQEAMDYLLAFADNPGMDDPLELPQPAATQAPSQLLPSETPCLHRRPTGWQAPPQKYSLPPSPPN